jgi:hypothetical protein
MCLYVYPPAVAKERLGKHVPAAMYTRGTIEDFLDTPFSMRFVSYQRKVDDLFFPELVVIFFWSEAYA